MNAEPKTDREHEARMNAARQAFLLAWPEIYGKICRRAPAVSEHDLHQISRLVWCSARGIK